MLTSTKPPRPAQQHAVEQTAVGPRASASNGAAAPSRPLRPAGDDGLACLPRKAANRRAGSALLQRYEIVTPAAVGANATAAGRYRVLGGRTEFRRRPWMHPIRGFTPDRARRRSDPAPLRRRQDGTRGQELSGRQPKVFYATSGVRSSSNSALKKVGSDYELYVDRANAIEVALSRASTDYAR